MLPSQLSTRWLSLMTVAAMAFVLSPLWLQSQSPAFRDGFHFYTPQLAWLDQCYAAGEYFPAWNSAEGLGSSVAGQPTWQLYYPWRILWFLPCLNLFQRLAIFVAVHLLLGMIGILRLRSVFDLTSLSAWFGAIAFAFSCPMLFQVNNLIYLCSATWVAWSLAPLLRLAATRRFTRYGIRQLLELLGIGCLLTLSGDPHTAANLSILLVVVIGYSTCSRWINRSQSSALLERSPTTSFISTSSTSVRLLPAFAIAIGLLVPTSLQIRATYNWYRLSGRSDQSPELRDSFHPHVDAILQDDKWDQAHRTFDFSLSPWNLPSLVWPTWGGHFQPTHSRWLAAIRSEGRMWMPSLYAGVLPFIFAIPLVFRRGNRWEVSILHAILIFALAAAMGNFSLGWFLRNTVDIVGANVTLPYWLGDVRTSLYGLLTQIIPGYSGFRYPAKWFIWCTAALAILGSLGLEQFLKSQKQIRLNKVSSALIVAGLTASLILLFVTQTPSTQQALVGWLQSADDRLLGAPDLSACCQALYRSWLQPSIVLLLTGGAMWYYRRRGTETCEVQQANTTQHRIAMLIVLLTLIDLASLARQWITTTDCAPSLAQAPSQSTVRCWANVGLANIDLVTGTTRRPTMADTLELQRHFKLGKLCLLTGESALHATGSIEPRSVANLKRWLVEHDLMIEQQPELDRVLLDLGVNRRLYQTVDGSLAWRDLGQDQTCELISPTTRGNPSATINWHWKRTDRLEIQLTIESDATLLIRQFNDGRWQIHEGAGMPLSIVPGELFIACEVPAGTHTLELSRRH